MYRSVATTTTRGGMPIFDHDVNSKIYLWRGNPWNLEVDAVVNSTNENFDKAQSSPGLHAAAGPGLAEECAALAVGRAGTFIFASHIGLLAQIRFS